MSKYWLYEWLDRNQANDIRAVETHLSRPSSVRELVKLAATSVPQLLQPAPSGDVLFSGTAMGLSGAFDCVDAECRIRHIDKLLRRAWHYFDSVVVQDTITPALAHQNDQLEPDLAENLRSYLRALLYIRQIGAEELIQFRIRRAVCVDHWPTQAERAGYGRVIGLLDDFSRRIERGSIVSPNARRDGAFEINFPGAELGPVAGISISATCPEQARLQGSAFMVRQFAREFVSDLLAASHLKCAFGSTVPLVQWMLEATVPNRGDCAQALEIRLPILDGVPVRELVRIRVNEQDAFRAFQHVLRKAIHELILEPDPSKQRVHQIERDLLLPELTRLRAKLAAAAVALRRKTTIGLVVGAAGTTIGCLVGVPVATAAAGGIAAAMASMMSAASRFIEAREAVESSDLYYLWRAAGHADRQP